MDDLEGTRARLRSAPRRGQPPETLLAESPDLIAWLEVDGIFSRVGDAAERLLGWRPETLLGRRLVDLAHPDDRPIVSVRLELAAAGENRAQTVAFRGRRVDGGWTYLETTLRPERDADGRVTGLASVTRDVSARRDAERRAHGRLREEAALGRVGAAIANGADAAELCAIGATEAALLLGADCGMVFRATGGGALERLAQAGPEGPAEPPEPLPEVPVDADTPVARAFRSGVPCPPVAYGALPGDHAAHLARRWHSGVAAPLILGGRPAGVVAGLAREEGVLEPGCEEALARLADLLATGGATRPGGSRILVDAATGLYTRAGLLRRLEEEIARARRGGHNLCVALIDIRAEPPEPPALARGDLLVAAGIAARVARASDVVARLPGDRLAWLLPECELAAVEGATGRLQMTLAERGSPAVRAARVVVGVCDLGHESAPERLLERAAIRLASV